MAQPYTLTPNKEQGDEIPEKDDNDDRASMSDRPTEVGSFASEGTRPTEMDTNALVCIMVLHQARLELMFKNFTNYKDVHQEKIRVLNGAILKFHINKDETEGTVDLIYKGCTTCDPKKEKYFTTDAAATVVENGPTYVPFLQLRYFLKTPAKQTVTTYGVRHGESLHNLKQYQTKAKLFSRKLSGSFRRAIQPWKFTNTSLTSDDGTADKGEGVQSIKDAGTKLYEILQKDNNTQIDYLCSSYLYRAMQTAAILYEQLTPQSNPIKFKRDKQIQIFPCINEKGSGWENVSFTRQTSVEGVPIDWTFYGTMGKNWFGATQLYKFGANKTRKLWGNKDSRKVTICPGPIELVIEAEDFYEKSKINAMSTSQLVNVFENDPNKIDENTYRFGGKLHKKRQNKTHKKKSKIKGTYGSLKIPPFKKYTKGI